MYVCICIHFYICMYVYDNTITLVNLYCVNSLHFMYIFKYVCMYVCVYENYCPFHFINLMLSFKIYLKIADMF